MNIARKLFAVALVAGCCASAAQAEVSAETDVFGTYLRTVVSTNASVKSLRVWSVPRVRPTHWPLNVDGDDNGDLWPYIAENPVQGRWPWVAWSRYNGSDYDLVWSRWTGRGWTEPTVVEATPTAGNALDPVITFDHVGRTYLVWVNQSPVGTSEIYYSVYLSSRWMMPLRVSAEGEGARDPEITILDDGSAQVSYQTDEGPVVRTLRVTRPWTITDDITPFGSMSVSEPRH